MHQFFSFSHFGGISNLGQLSELYTENRERSLVRNMLLIGKGLLYQSKQRAHSNGERNPRDWDKAWSAYRKLGKKKSFLSKINPNFNPDKYVSWDPKRSEYPLSEEVDPIKRTERTNLQLWTSPKFTLFGAVIVVSLLLVYTLSAPTK